MFFLFLLYLVSFLPQLFVQVAWETSAHLKDKQKGFGGRGKPKLGLNERDVERKHKCEANCALVSVLVHLKCIQLPSNAFVLMPSLCSLPWEKGWEAGSNLNQEMLKSHSASDG